jgi:hypothetical protein
MGPPRFEEEEEEQGQKKKVPPSSMVIRPPLFFFNRFSVSFFPAGLLLLGAAGRLVA